MPYNGEPNAQTLSQALALDANLRQNAVSRYFEVASGQFNALKNFTSVFDPKTKNGGTRSIFAEKTDLSKGGASVVNFNTIGIPGGPGTTGDTTLVGNESKALMGTYPVIVDWVRDAVSLTIDEIEMLAAGRNLEATLIELLAQKMGLVKQNTMLKRLIESAYTTPWSHSSDGVTAGNVFRPNNRSSIHTLTPTDTLTLDVSVNARARLQTLGAKPLMRNIAKAGCPIDKFLLFASSSAMLDIRNDSDFQSAINQADVRGQGNANFTGEILNWQGNPFYEFPVIDQDWDDFKGGPLIAKAVVDTSFGPNTAGAKLIANSANTKSLYFQWFDGYEYTFNRQETPADLNSNEYYAWAINPDGTVVFLAYNGGHNGNQITVTKILSPAATGSLDATTVGGLTTGTNALDPGASTDPDEFLGGGDSNLPASGPNGTWIYSNTVDVGAVIFQANRNGVPYTRSFMFGSMAACFAHGRVKMTQIEQDFDYEYVKGRGYMMIFGTGVCKNAQKRPNGYLLIEHAIAHEGYPLPSKV